MTAQFRIGEAPLGASCTAGDKFYDRMSEALGLPTVASADEWREMGRDIASCGIPRTVWGGVVVYGLEATFVPLGVAEEAPKTANLETKVSYDRTTGRTIYEPVYRPLEVPPFSVRVGATEKKRPPLTWATPAKFDPWKGFFTEPADIADWQDTYFPR